MRLLSRLPAAASRGGALRAAVWLQQQQAAPPPGRKLAVLVLARDGKKRRKPQSRDGGGSSSSSDEEPPLPAPRRVDPTINIGVRRQIRYAKLWKEYERQMSQGFRQKAPVPQSFRKDTLEPEEHRRLREERERLAAEAARQQSQLLTLQSMFKTGVSGPGEQPTGVTLVDGYNMLHMWRKLNVTVAELMAEAEVDPTSDALQAAREHLLKELDVYSNVEGMFVHVVFDAMSRGYESQHNKWGMIVNYCGKMEADTFILRQAQQYIDQGVAKVCIVTNDGEIAALKEAVEYREPGRQAVCASTCAALIKLLDQARAKLHDNLVLKDTLRQKRSPLSIQGRPRQQPASTKPLLGMAKLAGLRTSIVQQEREAAEEERQRQREERRRTKQQQQQQQQAGGEG